MKKNSWISKLLIFSCLGFGFVCATHAVEEMSNAMTNQVNHVKSFSNLPDPLSRTNGVNVVLVEEWETHRRGEILNLFETYVYGKTPIHRPESLKVSVVELKKDVMNGAAIRKQVEISFNGPGGEGKINLVLFIPRQRTNAAPCFVFICNRSRENIDPTRTRKTGFWPAEMLIERGYAAAAFHVDDLDPDYPDEFKNGVHGIFDTPGKQRPPDAWGTIAAWAWGASRVMDYLESDADVDHRRVAVVGHSRGGKAALWSGAQDQRFAMVVSNDSGSTGAAIARDKSGERIEQINGKFPHWFCENYKAFNGKEDELPIDQHMLLALVAPRLLYVSSATEDEWADPNNEFAACYYAQPVFHLYKLKGLEVNQMPLPDQPVHRGFIGYHLRTGKHNLTEFDWKAFLDYADQFLLNHQK